MNTTKKVKRNDLHLTEMEKKHMKLVQEARDHGVYHPIPSKKDIIRDAVNLALSRRLE